MLNRILLMLLTGLALAFTACGDDDDSGPTKAEFIEKADAICQESEQEVEGIARAAFADPENPTGAEILALLEELIPVQRDTLEQIRELDKPEADEDEINEFLDQADTATDEVAAIQDPQEAATVLQASDTPEDPYYEADKAAEEYGLKACSD